MRTIAQKILAVLFATFFVASAAYAATSALSGYGWAGQKDAAGNTVGIGWLAFNSTEDQNPDVAGVQSSIIDYGVSMAAAPSGTLSGYAWSSNIGYVNFAAPGCPSTDVAGCIPGAAADWSHPNSDGTINIKGWARACSAARNSTSCSGIFSAADITHAENPANQVVDPSGKYTDSLTREYYTWLASSGGWDGWIALSNPQGGTVWPYTPPKESVRFNPTTGAFSGVAWGDKVVGWVDFTGVKVTAVVPATCTDGTPAPSNDITKCPPVVNKCSDGTNAPGNDVTKCPAGNPPPDSGTKYCTDGTPAPSNDITKCPPVVNKCSDGTNAPGNDVTKCPAGNPPPAGVPYCTNLPNYTQVPAPDGVIRNAASGKCSCPVGKVMKLVNGVYNCAASHYEEH